MLPVPLVLLFAEPQRPYKYSSYDDIEKSRQAADWNSTFVDSQWIWFAPITVQRHATTQACASVQGLLCRLCRTTAGKLVLKACDGVRCGDQLRIVPQPNVLYRVQTWHTVRVLLHYPLRI